MAMEEGVYTFRGVLVGEEDQQRGGRLIRKLRVDYKNKRVENQYTVEVWENSLKYYADSKQKQGIKIGDEVEVSCFVSGRNGFTNLNYKSIQLVKSGFFNEMIESVDRDLF